MAIGKVASIDTVYASRAQMAIACISVTAAMRLAPIQNLLRKRHTLSVSVRDGFR